MKGKTHRSAARCHQILGIAQPPSLKLLRSAWNAFIRLLDLNYSNVPLPKIIICDGTLLGFRKDLAKDSTTDTLSTIHGSKHSDRTFICSAKACELLLNYSGYTKDRKRLIVPKCLSKNDLQALCKLLEKDSKALSMLIKSFHVFTAPSPYRDFFAELARNSPACSTFQYLGNDEVIEVLMSIVNDQFDLFNSISLNFFRALYHF